jgi:hypothetical protein
MPGGKARNRTFRASPVTMLQRGKNLMVKRVDIAPTGKKFDRISIVVIIEL